MLHRTRHLFIRQQTAVINSIRAHLAEFGIVAPVGRKGVTELLHIVADPSDKRVPEVARACLAALGNQLLSLKEQIVEFDRMIMSGTAPTKRASAFITFPVSVRYWQPLWSPALLTPGPSDQDATSRPGSGSFRRSTRAGARIGSAASANRVTAICAACSWPVHSPSSAMPRSTAPNTARGSRHC